MEQMAIAIMALIILPPLVFGYIKMKRHTDRMRHEMWRQVPPPTGDAGEEGLITSDYLRLFFSLTFGFFGFGNCSTLGVEGEIKLNLNLANLLSNCFTIFILLLPS